MKVRLAILWLVAVVGLLFVNYSIYGREQLISNGQPILLELAPVDPRSLIQGDYMALRYKIAVDLENQETLPLRGKLVINVAENGVASFVRLDDGTPLGPNERLLNYYKHEWQIDLGAPSFFFEEGTADAYVDAKYGEMRVDEGGTSVLIGLRDENLQPLGPVQQP
ncbi:MAG: hypothetical protein DYG89_26800 [Caldilinea sp. CFX5]|nr:hypothetical protein [Caldilinea sp. CFX5]